MSGVRAFLGFLYDFVVGDDPLIALVIVFALALTAAIADSGAPVWWVMPAAVLAALTFSVLRASLRAASKSEPDR